MSLTTGLYTSFQGLRDSSAKLAVNVQNVTNADKTGYSRKEYTTDFETIGNVTTAVGGTVQSIALDPYLQEQLVEDTIEAGRASVQADYLTRYADRLGTTDGENTLNASLDELASALDQLSVTPEDNSLKSLVVNGALSLSQDLRDLSVSVQDLRFQADQEIAQTVQDINSALEALDALNDRIVNAQATGDSAADLEDDRFVALEELSGLIDLDYFVDGNNRVQVYSSGRPLLSSDPHLLSYTPTSNVSGSVTYPGGFQGIIVDGNDITATVTGGKLGGLVNIRDGVLVEEQAKLDEYADVLKDQLNTLTNQGASVPSRSDIIGDERDLTAASAFTATGFVRIATTDQTGAVTGFSDIDLSTFANVGDVVTGINAALAPNVTASLTTDGELQLVSSIAGEGISINELDSSVGADADGFSKFFGLNNLFNGDGAEDILVSEYLRDNSNFLATSRLSDDAALVIGDVAVFVGDGTLSKEMNEALNGSSSFDAAGNFTSQTTSLSAYADDIISDIAGRASAAETISTSATQLAEQTRTNLFNFTGVNVDEELAIITELQTQYEAAATLISTIQELFDELLNAVR